MPRTCEDLCVDLDGLMSTPAAVAFHSHRAGQQRGISQDVGFVGLLKQAAMVETGI